MKNSIIEFQFQMEQFSIELHDRAQGVFVCSTKIPKQFIDKLMQNTYTYRRNENHDHIIIK